RRGQAHRRRGRVHLDPHPLAELLAVHGQHDAVRPRGHRLAEARHAPRDRPTRPRAATRPTAGPTTASASARPAAAERAAAVAGRNSTALACSASALTCRSAVTSRIQMLRPCVAAISSPRAGCWANSWTATVGRLLLIFVHDAPRLIDAQTANSVPR